VDAADITGELTKVLYTRQQVDDRLVEVAGQIDRDYEGKDLLLVGVLNGAIMVMADLSRAMKSHVEMDWMAISSYGSGTQSSGVVRILKDLSADIEGRHIMVVEDIIDTGFTLTHVLHMLKAREPARLRTCALLDKPSRREVPVKADWTGFEIPDEFVVGYGIDFAQRNRNLPFIGKVRFTEAQ